MISRLVSIEDALTSLLLRTIVERRPADDAVFEHVTMALHAFKRTSSKPSARAPRASRGGLASWQLRMACERLEHEADLGTAIHAAAAACHLSRSHFSRAFKASTGLSPTHWRLEQRVRHAQTLLEVPDLALVDIAAECGFADQSHFTNVFSRFRRQSPGAWRRDVARRSAQG
jgi:transcriptional regulator GlxA family with amidase domain